MCSQNNFTDVQVRWIDGRVHCSFVRPVSTTFYTYKYSRYGGQTMHIYNDLVTNEYYLFVASGDVYPGMEVIDITDVKSALWNFIGSGRFHPVPFSVKEFKIITFT